MTNPDERHDADAAHANRTPASSPLDLSPGRELRATTHGSEHATTHDDVDGSAPLQQHGDALLDGSGSRQGLAPDPARDAAPHE